MGRSSGFVRPLIFHFLAGSLNLDAWHDTPIAPMRQGDTYVESIWLEVT